MDPIVAVGTYTGSRPNNIADDELRVSLDFVPDLVIVAPRNGSPIMFRSNLSWHGKVQFLDSLSSENYLGSRQGRLEWRFLERGFRVKDVANPAGVVCDYIAIKDNGSGMFDELSYIGNAVSNRELVFTDSAADLIVVKRDGGTISGSTVQRPSIWKFGTNDNVWGTLQGGTAERIIDITSGGFRVTNDRQVNENDNNSLGEGIEALAFFQNSFCKVLSYTGNGAASQSVATGLASPSAAFILDGVNDASGSTQPHAFVSEGMSANNSKPFNGSPDATGKIEGFSGSDLVVGSEYNVSGRAYRVLVFAESAAAENAETVSIAPGAKSAAIQPGAGRITLPDNSVGATSTLEWYGRWNVPEDSTGTDELVPLLMLGEGADQLPPLGFASTDTYNGGLYLARTDPDGNDWNGLAVRFLQHDYLRTSRASASINSYNTNTGIILNPGTDYHLMLTHAGNKWRLYINGKVVKEYDYAPTSGRRPGGTGTPRPTVIGHLMDGASARDREPVATHRAAIWEGTALTDAQVRARYRDAVLGESGSYPAATQDHDFSKGLPPGVTATSIEEVDRVNITDVRDETAYQGQDAVTNNITHTASGLIPEAGTYAIGILNTKRSSNGTTVSSLTVDGVPITLAEAELADVDAGKLGDDDFRVTFYKVTTDSSAPIVVGYASQPLISQIAVWKIDPDTSGTVQTDTQLGNLANREVALSSVEDHSLLCVMCTATGNTATRTTGDVIAGNAFAVEWRSVGGSSKVTAGEGYMGVEGSADVTLTHKFGANGCLAAVAIPQPAMAYSFALRSAGSTGVLRSRERTGPRVART